MDLRYYVPGEGGDGLSIDGETADAAKDIARLLGKRWTIDVLANLEQQPRRFNELRRGIPDVSAKVLTDRLAEMVEAGLVDRRRVGTNHVRYSINPAAVELFRIAEELGAWKQEYMGDWGYDDPERTYEPPVHDPYKRRTIGEGAGIETPERRRD